MPDPTGLRRLPPPRDGRAGAPYRIVLVCLGNICRSPIARVVLTEKVARAGLAGRVEVTSAGIGDWHVGEPMDRRATAVLAAAGYDGSGHRAAQIDLAGYVEHDLVLAMDETNHTELGGLSADDGVARLWMFREFDPRAADGDRDVPDPYFGGDDGFDDVLSIVERTSDAIVDALVRELGRG